MVAETRGLKVQTHGPTSERGHLKTKVTPGTQRTQESKDQGKGKQRSIRGIMAVTVNLGIKFANVILDAKKKEKVIRSIFLR